MGTNAAARTLGGWVGRHPIWTALIALFLIGYVGRSLLTKDEAVTTMSPTSETPANSGQAPRSDAIGEPKTEAVVVPAFSQMTVAQHLAEAKRLTDALILVANGPDEIKPTIVSDMQQIESHLKEVLKRNPRNEEALHLYEFLTAAANQIAAKTDKYREAQAKTHPQDDLARIKCEEAASANLKAPSTSKFAPYSETHVLDLGNWQYRVQSYVDAENSFGAHIRTPYTCTVECNAVDSCAVTKLHFVQQ